jgi:hypothetical protein
MSDNEACRLKSPTRTPWNKGKLMGASLYDHFVTRLGAITATSETLHGNQKMPRKG